MSMQELDRDLWVIDHAFSVGGLAIGTRTTVVRRSDGTLVLLSPGPLGDDDVAALAALGAPASVRAIVAPNLMHHLFLAAAMARFPGAALYAPAALAKKQPTLTIAGPPAAAGDATFRALEIGGQPGLQESVFVHAPSRTLVATDLVFNVRPPAPWLTRTFMRFNGGFDRFGPTRICRRLCKDRAAMRASVERVLDHDFDRVVVAHGQVLTSGGHDAVRAGFDWLLDLRAAA